MFLYETKDHFTGIARSKVGSAKRKILNLIADCDVVILSWRVLDCTLPPEGVAEYANTRTSYKDLCEKYNVSMFFGPVMVDMLCNIAGERYVVRARSDSEKVHISPYSRGMKLSRIEW